MAIISWTALNVVLLLLILYAWIRVLMVLKRQIGIGLAALFLLSLSAFKSDSDGNTLPSKNLIVSRENTAPMGNWSNHTTKRLSAVSKLFFLVEGRKKEGVVQPIGLYVTVSGLLVGHEWKPIAGRVRSRYPNVIYHATVLHEWKLLGATLYTSAEEYSGRVYTGK